MKVFWPKLSIIFLVVKWNASGSKLLTGSDDRLVFYRQFVHWKISFYSQVKIWDTSGSFDNIGCLHTITTGHHHNIFCVSYAGNSEHKVLSCSGDGDLRLTELGSSQLGSVLFESEKIM